MSAFNLKYEISNKVYIYLLNEYLLVQIVYILYFMHLLNCDIFLFLMYVQCRAIYIFPLSKYLELYILSLLWSPAIYHGWYVIWTSCMCVITKFLFQNSSQIVSMYLLSVSATVVFFVFRPTSSERFTV